MTDFCPLCGQALIPVFGSGVRSGCPALLSDMVHAGGGVCKWSTPPLVSPDTVYLEDCIAGMGRMGEASVDLVVTDPPYLIDYQTNRRRDKTHDFCTPIQNDHNPDLIHDYLRECYRILRQDKAAYVFCSSKTLDIFRVAAQNAGFLVKNTVIWVKNSHTAGDLKAQFGQQYEVILLLNKGRAQIRGDRLTDVWEFPRVAGKKQLHQNQKPLELIERCIDKHSDVGDVVFDGFMGSGTTAIGALHKGRRFVGFEIEPRYFWMIHNRLCEEVQHDENRTG